MAAPVTFSGSKMLILVGDGATPESFDAPCGLETKGLSRSAETTDTTTPDCDDPSLPAWTDREVVTLSWEASGSGKLTAGAVPVWDEWFSSGALKNVRVEIYSGALAGKKYTGAAVLTQYNISGERGDKATVEVTLSGSGVLTAADIS